jgi:hypothetical protein
MSTDYLPTVPIAVPEYWHLPLYVPQIHHGYRRTKPLEIACGFAAISIADLVSYAATASTPSELRRRFQLADRTRIIAVGVARDNWLERWWHDFERPMSLLRALGIIAVTVPNFSLFADAPRHQTLINIARLHHFAERLSNAGLPVVPHLYAENFKDWNRWAEFLTVQSHIRFLAVEFQTALVSAQRAADYILGISELQERVGRKLHILAIGGARYMNALDEKGLSITVIDSQPFMKALYRRHFNALPPHDFEWVARFTRPTECLSPLLMHNVLEYALRLERIVSPRRAPVHALAA